MRLSGSLAVLLAGVTSLVSAVPFTGPSEQPSEKRGYCGNSPKSRKCWGNYDIDTDVAYEWPNTGVTHGVEKRLITVNGQYPGPLLEANWGDDVEVKVCNHLPDNGTSIHWHGIRQFYTNYADGATSQTECPIAPETATPTSGRRPSTGPAGTTLTTPSSTARACWAPSSSTAPTPPTGTKAPCLYTKWVMSGRQRLWVILYFVHHWDAIQQKWPHEYSR
ncbi:hypothetical protein SMACR_09721 [Sordaria macrospora]|uniref:WGS project CABT00000000 data, contig 2.162 n=2 Tax=Sordaria macrospora TaxID=5147 RepID=F7WCM3_SORMK|nr:uncharacterized protein SMAC_09721 [Sordaria macrospora k-hell]KAA8620685.1 hypothetical protein SMACR_09721 [Sordaria macrospora]KAH7626111.1 multicopper oxidase-domain-containing protein [Sordaria sp. MPI-SDFR-AT-0083]WPJ61287.1 hypothetical protein SMAC4_09721 [Sordaria macrospora]CCC05657.1 unnamed protein product [Sordaria macrospora k-hell]